MEFTLTFNTLSPSFFLLYEILFLGKYIVMNLLFSEDVFFLFFYKEFLWMN